jgi:hypothetical protein
MTDKGRVFNVPDDANLVAADGACMPIVVIGMHAILCLPQGGHKGGPSENPFQLATSRQLVMALQS